MGILLALTAWAAALHEKGICLDGAVKSGSRKKGGATIIARFSEGDFEVSKKKRVAAI